jgi:hypothetical protein
MDCVFAFTEMGVSSFPGYVNLSDRDGVAELTVRTRGHDGMQCAVMPVPDDQLWVLVESVKSYLQKKGFRPHVGLAAEDFELPPACPLRNEGDDTCEACQ